MDLLMWMIIAQHMSTEDMIYTTLGMAAITGILLLLTRNKTKE